MTSPSELLRSCTGRPSPLNHRAVRPAAVYLPGTLRTTVNEGGRAVDEPGNNPCSLWRYIRVIRATVDTVRHHPQLVHRYQTRPDQA